MYSFLARFDYSFSSLFSEKLRASENVAFPPPKFNGVDIPGKDLCPFACTSVHVLTACSSAPAPVAARPPAGAAAAAGVPLPPPQAYAMTQEDKIKYDGLFSGYDADGDGYILGGEAVAIFNHSGLDVQVLRGVWALADDDKDSKLSKLEFAVAFHLIMCIRYACFDCRGVCPCVCLFRGLRCFVA
jgi:hypothetical protein